MPASVLSALAAEAATARVADIAPMTIKRPQTRRIVLNPLVLSML
jgi:hypothetical protein